MVDPAATQTARSNGATRSSACSTSRASSAGGRSTSGMPTSSPTPTAPRSPAQYRLMIRTERSEAVKRKKYDAIEPQVWTEDEIDEIDAQYEAEHAARRRAALVRGRRGGRRDHAADQGPAHRHRHGRLAHRHGHGRLRRRARCASATRTASASPASTTATSRASGTPCSGCTGIPEFARRSGNPTTFDYGRMRETLDDPRLHRLDGRRRLAVEAPRRVPPVQLRRRRPEDHRNDHPQVPGRGRRTGCTRRSTWSLPRPTSAAR